MNLLNEVKIIVYRISLCVCHFSQCQVRMSNLLLPLLVKLISSCWSQQCKGIYKESSSCKDILEVPATSSGFYSLKTSISKVYCDMDTECCGGKGWTRVAYIDMYNNLQSCPGDVNLINTPIRTCGDPCNHPWMC